MIQVLRACLTLSKEDDEVSFCQVVATQMLQILHPPHCYEEHFSRSAMAQRSVKRKRILLMSLSTQPRLNLTWRRRRRKRVKMRRKILLFSYLKWIIWVVRRKSMMKQRTLSKRMKGLRRMTTLLMGKMKHLRKQRRQF